MGFLSSLFGKIPKMVAENDEKMLSQGIKPKYMVTATDGGRVAFPCVSRNLAECWRSHLKSRGVDTQIIDLTHYDWERNPLQLNINTMQ